MTGMPPTALETVAASFSQGTPEPASLPRHVYGAGGTIHQTGTIDVQVDEDGEVVGVWFRCLLLPFTVHQVRKEPSLYPPSRIAVESITYVEKPVSR
jgi:hypothetical protein